MNVFLLNFFYEIKYMNGWDDKNPKEDYVMKKFKVCTNFTKDELRKFIDDIKRPEYLGVSINGTVKEAFFEEKSLITERDLERLIKDAHLGICFD